MSDNLFELDTATIAASTRYRGHGHFNVSAGNELKIEGDEDIFSETVPAGKTWEVCLQISINETPP